LHPVGSAARNCSAGAALHGKTGRDCGAREAPAGLSPLYARQVSTRLRARHNLRPTSTGRRMRRFRSLFLGLLLAVTASAGQAAVLVPPGNRNAVQPAIPGASVNRTQATNTTFQAKYRKVYALLKNDGRLRAKIKETAAAYAIDPIHIVGAIVGEHTYNVDAYDRLQTYYVKAVSYFESSFTFSHGGETIAQFVERPEFARCAKISESYKLWTCREAVWNSEFRGKTVGGKAFPANRFSAVFFQPFYAGQTFGIGQLNPLTALQMSDLVNKVSGLPKLSADKPQQVYKTIMDPDLTLAYMAATLKKSI